MNENFIKVSKKLIFKKVLLFLCIFLIISMFGFSRTKQFSKKSNMITIEINSSKIEVFDATSEIILDYGFSILTANERIGLIATDYSKVKSSFGSQALLRVLGRKNEEFKLNIQIRSSGNGSILKIVTKGRVKKKSRFKEEYEEFKPSKSFLKNIVELANKIKAKAEGTVYEEIKKAKKLKTKKSSNSVKKSQLQYTSNEKHALGADLKLRVITRKANVRLKPSLNSDILSQAPLGAILESEGKVGNWFKVNLPADESGFVVSGYIYESIVEEVIQEFKEPTIKEESPPVVNEERESYIQQKSPVTEKKPIKKYSFRCGLGLSFPSGDWSDLFGLGLGLSVGNGISIVRKPMFDIDLLGSLEVYIFFREAAYTDISWTRYLLSGDCRFSLKVDPITVFAQGGLGVYLDVLTIEYWWWVEETGSKLRFGPRIGGGVTFRNLEIMAMYHMVKDNMFTIMGSVIYRF